MTDLNSTKFKHLTLDDRIEIHICLDRGVTFKAIATRVGKDLLKDKSSQHHQGPDYRHTGIGLSRNHPGNKNIARQRDAPDGEMHQMEILTYTILEPRNICHW